MKNSVLKSYSTSIFISFIEWFEFLVFVYLFMNLFEGKNEIYYIALFKKIGILISFFARPLGAYIFSKISVRKGRVDCLVSTIYLMLFSSILFIIAVLIKEQILICLGLAAIARFLQGMALGGEFTNSVLYIYEIAKKKSTAIAIAGLGAGLGMTLATYAPNLLQPIKLIEHKILIAYSVSIVFAIVAIFLRKSMIETRNIIIKFKNTNNQSIYLLSFNIFKYIFPYVFFIYYILGIYPEYLNREFKITNEIAEYYLTYFSFFTAVVPILFGLIADKYGVSKVLKWTLIANIIYIPLFAIIKNPIFQINYISILVSSYWAVSLTKLFSKTNITQLYLGFPVIYNIVVAIISSQIVTFFNIGLNHDIVLTCFMFLMFIFNINDVFNFKFRDGRIKIYGN